MSALRCASPLTITSKQCCPDGDFQSVVIDLVEAEGIDSTTLGLLAKVSIRAQERYGYRPVIISTNENITRLITSMGFDMVFDIRTEAISDDESLQALADTASSEEGVRERVLAAAPRADGPE